jgi:murein DD-endopeptidase MepM/ murein hydrolase activator NlpD
MKKHILVSISILALAGCAVTHKSSADRKVSSLEKSVFTCDNGTQEITPAENIIPVGDNLYYPIKSRRKPDMKFGDDYIDKTARHRKGVLRPHAVFESPEPQEIRAIHSGTIRNIGPWQRHSISVTIISPDGHQTRYGGLDRKSLERKSGEWVEAGDVFASTVLVGRAPFNSPALYLEVFSGEEQGSLTMVPKKTCFNRRDDILDTRQWLEKIEAITFDPRDI